jgi:predicted porin
MKKLLIATAALAMVAGTAQAQSSVTVYGVIDTGYNSLKTTATDNKVTEANAVAAGQLTANGEAASSRLGFRGTEDLGGGLKANFVVESNIGATTANAVGDRAFWAGLEDAKMGQLRVGRQDTFVRSAWLAHDQLAMANVVGNLAHSTELTGAATATTNTATGSHTARNVAVNYLSPRFSGVQLSLGMTQSDSEVTGSAKQKTGSGSQVGLSYVAGKLSAAAAYDEATTSTNSVGETLGYIQLAGGTTTPTLGAAAAAATNVKTKNTGVAASYDFGVAKVAYIYNKREAVNSVSALTATNVDRESNAFSVSVPVGAKTVLRAGYGFGEYKQSTGTAAGFNGDTKGYQAAINYNLSKRTMAYAIYGDEKRETSAT